MNIKEIRLNHSVSLLVYHLIFVTKCRRKELQNISIDLFKRAIEKYPITILEGEIGENDHVHLMIQTDTTVSPAQIAKIVKGCSQVLIRKEIPEWSGWSRSYYISSVSNNNLDTVTAYIRGQKD